MKIKNKNKKLKNQKSQPKTKTKTKKATTKNKLKGYQGIKVSIIYWDYYSEWLHLGVTWIYFDLSKEVYLNSQFAMRRTDIKRVSN